MAKDQLWHIHSLFLVHLNWDAPTIVPHADGVIFLHISQYSASEPRLYSEAAVHCCMVALLCAVRLRPGDPCFKHDALQSQNVILEAKKLLVFRFDVYQQGVLPRPHSHLLVRCPL